MGRYTATQGGLYDRLCHALLVLKSSEIPVCLVSHCKMCNWVRIYLEKKCCKRPRYNIQYLQSCSINIPAKANYLNTTSADQALFDESAWLKHNNALVVVI